MSMDKIFMCDEQKFCSRVVSPSEFLHHSVHSRNILERTMQLRHDDVSPIDHFANLAGTTVDVSKTIFELCETEISRLKDPDTNFNFDVETGFDDSVVPRYPLKIFEHLQNERERRLNPQNKSIALRAMRYDVIDPRLITNKGFNIKGIPDKWKEETKIGRPAVPEQNPEIPPNVIDNPDVMPTPAAPEPCVTLRSQNLPWGHDDVLIYVSVYLGYGRTLQYHEIRLGRLMKVTDRLVLRGDQTLYDLKKSFHCLQDYMCLEDVSHRNPTPDDLTLNLFPSSYFFIHDTFFIDDRKEGAKDTSECVRTWAQGRTNIDEMYVDNMDTKLIDLKFRLGQPYLYQHQGICEHTIVFTDYHLRDYNDQVGPYPLRLLERQFRRIACIGCRTENADWAVMGCEILPTTPAYLCRNCYKDLLFHADGNKRCNFQAVPYFDRKAMDDYGVFLDMLRKNVLPVKKEEANENDEGFGVQPSQPVAKRRKTVDVDDDDDMSSYTRAGSIRSLDSSDSGQ